MSLSLGAPSENDDDGLMTAINTTPLIDVMLVLLVMIIITIPVQLHSVNMTTQKNTPSPETVMVPRPTPPVIVDITINATNQILWNGDLLATPENLQARMEQAAKNSVGGEQPHLHIHPSPQAKYEYIARVLATAQRSGLTKIGITDASL